MFIVCNKESQGSLILLTCQVKIEVILENGDTLFEKLENGSQYCLAYLYTKRNNSGQATNLR